MVNKGGGTVKHEPVKRPEPSSELAWASKRGPGSARYDLATALRIVRRMETSTGRAAVFSEIKRKNALYRMVDALYSNAGASTMQPLLLFAYMLKCVLSPGPFDADDAEAVSISQFDNEHHTIDRLVALVPGARFHRMTMLRRHLVGRGQLRATFRMLGSAWRIWPFLSRLVRAHSFMPSARIASALAFYMRFLQLFADHPRLTTAVVTSNYSPEAVGLAAAAHQTGRRVIYMNHAPVPANAAVVPPVFADCAIFYGEAVTRAYERRSRCSAEVALIGQPLISRHMQWCDELKTVGIFLTSGTKTDAVSDLVSAIRASHPGVRILIRNHPVTLIKSDFSDLAARHDNLAVTIGNPLDDEIAACDLVVCGNSGVATNVVSGGRPVAYMNKLDVSGFDYNGFVASGLICNAEGWSDDIYRQLRDFYDRPEWRAIMRTYDASYDADIEALKQAATETILRHLSPPARSQ